MAGIKRVTRRVVTPSLYLRIHRIPPSRHFSHKDTTMANLRRKGRSRAQKKQLTNARDSRQSEQKENIPPTSPPSSPKTRRLAQYKISNTALKTQRDVYKRKYELAMRREMRHLQQNQELKEGIKRHEERIFQLFGEVQAATRTAESTAAHLMQKHVKSQAELQKKLTEASQKIALAEQAAKSDSAELSALRASIRILKKRVNRQSVMVKNLRTGSQRARAVARTHLKRGRSYKVEVRHLARLLIACGCKQGKVGKAIDDVASIFGIDLPHTLSRRTVSRIALEGLVMARVQLGFELQQTQDFTMSSDGTGRKKIQYQSHHVHMKVPVGRDAAGKIVLSEKPKIRFAGVHQTVDHSTATSKAVWMQIYEDIMKSYNDSPLGKRTGPLDLRMICRRLRGMCGDHANNEKALAEVWKEFKHETLLAELGEKRLQELDGQVAEVL
ncbi:hypothetical protein R3P38DRAFT_3357441, partial [Favolaschia claudopus]